MPQLTSRLLVLCSLLNEATGCVLVTFKNCLEKTGNNIIILWQKRFRNWMAACFWYGCEVITKWNDSHCRMTSLRMECKLLLNVYYCKMCSKIIVILDVTVIWIIVTRFEYAYWHTYISLCKVQMNMTRVKRCLAKALAHIEWRVLFVDTMFASAVVLGCILQNSSAVLGSVLYRWIFLLLTAWHTNRSFLHSLVHFSDHTGRYTCLLWSGKTVNWL